MAEKVLKLGLAIDPKNFLYYIDDEGSIIKYGVGGRVVVKLKAIEKNPSSLYYVDKDGDVSCLAKAVGLKRDEPEIQENPIS